MIPMGVQFAASALVGNAIGADKPKQAKRFAVACIIFAVCIVTVVCIMFNIFDESIARIFTKDGQTVWYI
jgi:Na+-driven multidrug efflux pump